MSNKKFSQLPHNSSPASADIIPFQTDAGITSKVTVDELQSAIKTDPILSSSLDGAYFPPVLYRSGDAYLFQYNILTYSGWGSSIGKPQNFNRVAFDIFPWSKGNEPHIVRVRIKDTDYNGAVLADVCVGINPIWNEEYRVIADLPITIANADNHYLWLEYFCDGLTGIKFTYPISHTNVGWRVAAGSSITSTTLGTPQGNGNIYAEFSLSNVTNITELGLPAVYTGVYGDNCSAWGTPMGSPQNFNRMEFFIRAFDLKHYPTKLHLTIKQTDVNGAILYDSPAVNITPKPNELHHIIWDLPDTIANANDDNLWFELKSDGYFGYAKTNPVVISDPQQMQNHLCDLWAPITGNSGVYNFYLKFSLVDRTKDKATSRNQVVRRLQSVGDDAVFQSLRRNVDLLLPSYVYATEGIETNIYWDNVFKSYLPVEQFNFVVTGDVGKVEDNRYTVVPIATDAGDHTIVISVFYLGKLIAKRSTTLRIKAKTAGNGITRKCLVIGDSLTESSGGVQTQTVLDNITADGSLALTLIGTKGTPPNSHEGISGKTFHYFYSDAASPFVFSGAFNFSQYLSTNGFSLSAGDWVIISLGTNDFAGSYVTEASLEAQRTSVYNDLTAMITNIKAAVSGIKIAVALSIPPNYHQDGFGNVYTMTQNVMRNQAKYNRDGWVRFAINNWDGVVANVYMCPLGLNIDTRNNFVTADVALNSRNATTYKKTTDSVHPATSGYQQMGDAIYAFIKGFET